MAESAAAVPTRLVYLLRLSQLASDERGFRKLIAKKAEGGGSDSDNDSDAEPKEGTIGTSPTGAAESDEKAEARQALKERYSDAEIDLGVFIHTEDTKDEGSLSNVVIRNSTKLLNVLLLPRITTQPEQKAVTDLNTWMTTQPGAFNTPMLAGAQASFLEGHERYADAAVQLCRNVEANPQSQYDALQLLLYTMIVQSFFSFDLSRKNLRLLLQRPPPPDRLVATKLPDCVQKLDPQYQAIVQEVMGMRPASNGNKRPRPEDCTVM
jgi:hypothetical protein